jgi:hypothetical protein
MTLEAALSSGGVLGPTRGEGRATGRVVTGGDQKEKTGVWAVRLTDSNRRQAVVGWAMAQKVIFIGVHSRAKWATVGACMRAQRALCRAHACARCSGAGAGETSSGRR